MSNGLDYDSPINHGDVAMSKYHVKKGLIPLCGTKGNGNRFNVVCLPLAQWKELINPESRCTKCAALLEKKS